MSFGYSALWQVAGWVVACDFVVLYMLFLCILELVQVLSAVDSKTAMKPRDTVILSYDPCTSFTTPPYVVNEHWLVN